MPRYLLIAFAWWVIFTADAVSEVGPPFEQEFPELDRAYNDLAAGRDRRAILEYLHSAAQAADDADDADKRKPIEAAAEGIRLAIEHEAELAKLDPASIEYKVLKLIDSAYPIEVWQHTPNSYAGRMRWPDEGDGRDPFDQILPLKDAAIPVLIQYLDDRAYTRIVFNNNLWDDQRFVLPLNYAALCLIEMMSGCYFDIEPNGAGQAHVERWWRETAGLSRLERIKWQFPHSKGMGMESMFRELRRAGEHDFLRSILRPRADWWKDPGSAQFMAELGEIAPLDEYRDSLTNPIRTIEFRRGAVHTLTLYGGPREYEALVRLIERAIDGEERANELMMQLFLTASESRRQTAPTLLKAFLRYKASIERHHWISTHPHDGTLRYCDAAMYFLAKRRIAPEFRITWSQEDRDQAIDEYLQHPAAP